MRTLTIGFTKKDARRFFTLLRESGAVRVVDVRLNNVSQLAGFAKKDDLRFFLKEICGLDYAHESSLAPTEELLAAYRGKRSTWAEYESGYRALLAERRVEDRLARADFDGACLLCSEHEPRFCHRRVAAEYLREHWGDVEIVHLL